MGWCPHMGRFVGTVAVSIFAGICMLGSATRAIPAQEPVQGPCTGTKSAVEQRCNIANAICEPCMERTGSFPPGPQCIAIEYEGVELRTCTIPPPGHPVGMCSEENVLCAIYYECFYVQSMVDSSCDGEGGCGDDAGTVDCYIMGAKYELHRDYAATQRCSSSTSPGGNTRPKQEAHLNVA